MILACEESKHESTNTCKLLPFIKKLLLNFSDKILQFNVRHAF